MLEHPELVAGLHREFVHAGSDVVEAFTYYAHREKLRMIGKEDLIEPLNRARARASPREVAAETRRARRRRPLQHQRRSTPTTASRAAVRAMFEEQVGWIVDAGMDFVVAETFSWGEEALLALEAIKAGRAARGRHAGDPPRGRDARGLERPRRPARAWRTRAPTSSGSTASAARARCCR